MANYKKTYDKKGNVKLTELTPEEAVEIIDEGAPYKVKVNEPLDRGAKEAKLLGSTKEAIALRKAEIAGKIKLRQAELKGEIDTIKANESAKEKAGKHLAVFGAAYLTLCTVFFIGMMALLPTGESIAVAATLVTLVVTQIASILKTVVDTKEPRDPVELMSEIVHKTLGDGAPQED